MTNNDELFPPNQAPYGWKKNGQPKKKPGPAKGDERMIEIGRKGGMEVAKRGKAFYQEIGRKGGETTRDKYGPEHYSAIGEKGGLSLIAERGKGHFVELGKKNKKNV